MSELKDYNILDIEAMDDERLEKSESGKIQVTRVYIKEEADKVIAELKSSEDVLVTDNRDLMEKVKKLEERLHENAEHYKRNEAQILDNADKEIAEKDKKIAELQKQGHDYAQGLYVIQARAEKEARHHKHKRCLAMVRLCESNVIWVKGCSEWRRWKKWHKRWLKLAEQFKEAK